jgi:ComF family protein
MNLVDFRQNLLDIFFPNRCLACQKHLHPSEFICDECKGKLEFLDQTICVACQENTATDGICDKCRLSMPFDGLVSVFKFNPTIQSLIHNFKYNEFKKIGSFLGDFLGAVLSEKAFLSNIDYIIPVPLHSVKNRERGFNQAGIIANRIAQTLDISLEEKVVVRRKYTKTQTKLPREERSRNVQNAFAVKNAEIITNKNVLIVDDVFTTGATMKSIADTLKANKVDKVYACTIIRA